MDEQGRRGPVRDYVCLDLETTGLNPKRDAIIEIGARKMCGGVESGRFSALVYPGRKLDQKVTELTGLTDEMLQDAPLIQEVIREVLDFCGDLPLLGHSVSFDYAFLKRAAVNEKLTFEARGIDTLKLARRYLPELESRNLGALCAHYGIAHEAHRAMGDVLATCSLYEILCAQFYEEKTFQPFPLIYQVKREGPITKPQKERLERLLAQYGIQPDYEISLLTKNEASRKIDKLLAAVHGDLQKP